MLFDIGYKKKELMRCIEIIIIDHVSSKIAQNTSKVPNGISMHSIMHYYPSVSPHAATLSAKSIEGINSCQVSIYYTWFERQLWTKCGT